MGRTNPTYRDAIARLEERWAPMRRGLRRPYQADFDRLFDRARGFAHAAGQANPADPERALLVSLALAHEVELREVRERLERLEETAGQTGGRDSTGEDGTDRGEDGTDRGDRGDRERRPD